MSHPTWSARDVSRRLLTVLMGAALLLPVPSAFAAEDTPADLSDVRVSDETVTATLVLRSDEPVTVDDGSVNATIGGFEAPVTVSEAGQQQRSTMLVIDTSGSMGTSGMATVRSAVGEFLDTVPDDVKVGVVSFADTAGVDVKPTTDHDAVESAVAGLVSRGETALYQAVQEAVDGLGTKGERSIILLSDGGDTVENLDGGAAQSQKERKAALKALEKSKVRAEVIAFKSAEADTDVLDQFAEAGGGSVAGAGDDEAVSAAFAAAARTLESQSALELTRPNGVTGDQEIVVAGTAGGSPFEARTAVDLGDTAPLPTPETPEASPTVVAAAGPLVASSPSLLLPAVAALALGLFLLVLAFSASAFRSRRRERVLAVESYGGWSVREQSPRVASSAALSGQLVDWGDRVMEGRRGTNRTMMLIERADLPWRAGEWLLIRILAVVIGGSVGYLLLVARAPWVGLVLGLVFGLVAPALMLRYLARRRARAFEAQLPEVLMLVATSLASGFSLLQALDSVAKDAAEPSAKEFSRALAEARIGADVSDALDHMAVRMDSQNMRWTTMAIRIQREVGGNLADTLRTTAATLREREQLRRQVRALSAEGRLSAVILIILPIGMFFYMLWVNYDYVSLLWNTVLGIVMLFIGAVLMIVGVLWMRKVVDIEV